MSSVSSPPRVSGIVSVRNMGAYVGAAIESALGQTHADFELVVVDDASTDGTTGIIAAYVERDPRVRLFHQAECGGPSATRNLALLEARGEWIAVLDADDLWRPNRLKLQLAVVDADPAVRLVTADYQHMDIAACPLGIFPCVRPEWWLRWRLLLGNSIGGHSQVLFQREAALACGGYRSDFDLAEDYRLWLDLARMGRVAYVHEVLMDYRMHDKSLSAMNRQAQQRQSDRISDEAISALLGESLFPERLACLRDFWSDSLPISEGSLPQLGRDLGQLEDLFWRQHPAEASPANRVLLQDRIRRRWALYALHFKKSGSMPASLAAWRYAVA